MAQDSLCPLTVSSRPWALLQRLLCWDFLGQQLFGGRKAYRRFGGAVGTLGGQQIHGGQLSPSHRHPLPLPPPQPQSLPGGSPRATSVTTPSPCRGDGRCHLCQQVEGGGREGGVVAGEGVGPSPQGSSGAGAAPSHPQACQTGRRDPLIEN